MTTVDAGLAHPAVEIARQRVIDFDPSLTPVAVATRPDVVAVLLQSDDKRFTVFVVDRAGEWIPPDYICGTPRRVRQREADTGHRPLYNVSRSWFGWPSSDGDQEEGWFSVTGMAALDATELAITSTLESTVAPIDEAGLAFGIVRARRDDQPAVEIRTRDGRAVAVRP